MLPFLARACWRKLWTLFLISIVSFLVIHLAPGAPSQIDPMNPRFTKEQLQRYRAAFDLDKPLHVQYGLFYQRLFTGQLRSFKDNQPVLPKIVERAWNSLPLFVVATILVWCFAFPLGITTAIRRDSWFDRATTVLVFALISIPGFYLSYLAIIFVVQTFQVDVIGIQTFGREPSGAWVRIMDRTWHLVLPSFAIGVGQVVPGWDKTLVGAKIGSRMILAIPPADGYGAKGNPKAGIKGTDTLYFVVDILAAS